MDVQLRDDVNTDGSEREQNPKTSISFVYVKETLEMIDCCCRGGGEDESREGKRLPTF